MTLKPKRKSPVILGAGTSMPCGIPGVAAIDALMQDWSRNWKMPIGFPDGAGDGVFNDLWRAIDQYQKRKPRPQLGLKLNFERVLGEMIALASWVSPSPFGNPLREAVEDGHISGFTWPQHGEGEYFHRQLIIEQLASLLRALADHMRKASQSLDEGSAAFTSYRDIFAGLRAEFDVGIYNLNYDNLALRACPGAFTGFTEGQFDPKEFMHTAGAQAAVIVLRDGEYIAEVKKKAAPAHHAAPAHRPATSRRSPEKEQGTAPTPGINGESKGGSLPEAAPSFFGLGF